MDNEMQKIYDYLTPEQKVAANLIQTNMISAFDNFDWTAHMAEEVKRQAEAIQRANWVVETKIADDNRSVEISAVIKDSHGHRSWGWHDEGETKYVVLRTEATYQKVPVMGSVIRLAEDEARKICRIKN